MWKQVRSPQQSRSIIDGRFWLGWSKVTRQSTEGWDNLSLSLAFDTGINQFDLKPSQRLENRPSHRNELRSKLLSLDSKWTSRPSIFARSRKDFIFGGGGGFQNDTRDCVRSALHTKPCSIDSCNPQEDKCYEIACTIVKNVIFDRLSIRVMPSNYDLSFLSKVDFPSLRIPVVARCSQPFPSTAKFCASTTCNIRKNQTIHNLICRQYSIHWILKDSKAEFFSHGSLMHFQHAFNGIVVFEFGLQYILKNYVNPISKKVRG